MRLWPRIRLPRTFTPTHDTAGLPNFPAIDVFAEPGTLVMPPEGGTIVDKHYIEWSKDRRVGGFTIYLQTKSGYTYFITHLMTARRNGPVRRFQSIGRVGEVPHAWWPAHIHHAKHKGIYAP